MRNKDVLLVTYYLLECILVEDICLRLVKGQLIYKDFDYIGIMESLDMGELEFIVDCKINGV
jgi:hypothetical protein